MKKKRKEKREREEDRKLTSFQPVSKKDSVDSTNETKSIDIRDDDDEDDDRRQKTWKKMRVEPALHLYYSKIGGGRKYLCAPRQIERIEVGEEKKKARWRWTSRGDDRIAADD